jgi:hypothetical protein
MRAAPLGAWHADSLPHAAAQGARAPEVTHAHPEGIAGGVAVAVAAAIAAAGRLDGQRPASCCARWPAHTPDGRVRDGLRRRLGSDIRGARTSWAPARGDGAGHGPVRGLGGRRFLDDYPAAIAACAAAGGDVDTTCAIAGGIVARTRDGRHPGRLAVRPRAAAGLARGALA